MSYPDPVRITGCISGDTMSITHRLDAAPATALWTLRYEDRTIVNDRTATDAAADYTLNGTTGKYEKTYVLNGDDTEISASAGESEDRLLEVISTTTVGEATDKKTDRGIFPVYR